MKVIFSLYVDLPEDLNADPATFTKDKVSKYQFEHRHQQLVDRQRQYAEQIGAEYIHLFNDKECLAHMDWIQNKYPYLSPFDAVNFLKHNVMFELAKQYDHVCYFDLDIIPNTSDNIFEAFPKETFNVPVSNADALWGKINLLKYKHDIRNPATKYWNAHAMLSHDDLPADQNVYNTGIMLATSDLIRELDYFDTFDEDLKLMTFLKNDPDSLYPKAIQQVFNYDNETLFSYKVIKNNVPITPITNDWHCVLKDGMETPQAKMYHVIDKLFQRFFK